jgi:cytochrome bd-type quinol oxidase subunit 1
MRDTSYVVGLFAVLFLVVAAVAGYRILRTPDQKPPTEQDAKRASSAAMVIVIAFLLSAVAAGFALLGLF